MKGHALASRLPRIGIVDHNTKGVILPVYLPRLLAESAYLPAPYIVVIAVIIVHISCIGDRVCLS